MARNQLYIYTTVILLVLLFVFMYYINVFSVKIKDFYNYYRNFGKLYYLEKFSNDFYKIKKIEGAELIYFTVHYNCDNTTISIPNYFRSRNVQVLDENFNFLKTYPDTQNVNFTVNEKIFLNNNICVFSGYLLKNNNIIINVSKNGEKVYDYTFIEINTNKLVSDFYDYYNFLFKDFKISFKDCIFVSLNLPVISIKLPISDISKLSYTYVSKTSNSVTISIKNNFQCPVVVNGFYYTDANDYYFYNESFILYPGELKYVTLYRSSGNIYIYDTNTMIEIEVP